ncbi:MAG TPA: YgiT-type zinc finger protein [Thermoanaerobaculia bacterium]|nr:YgiT-type zinc finger protein [Thermoanaerobaculia bacterium]
MSLPERVVSPAPRSFGLYRSTPRRVNPVDLDATLPLAPERPQETHEVLAMKCLYCQAPVERTTTEYHVNRNGYNLSWQNLPAWVCTRCDQAYFEPREVQMVRQAVSSMTRLGK